MIRFVNLMEGHIWIESEGLGKGCTANFIVKLGFPERSNESKLPFAPKGQTNHVQTNFPGLKVIVMDENGSVTLHFSNLPFNLKYTQCLIKCTFFPFFLCLSFLK